MMHSIRTALLILKSISILLIRPELTEQRLLSVLSKRILLVVSTPVYDYTFALTFEITSKPTAMSRTNPLIACCQSMLTPTIDIPLLRTPISRPPTIAPTTVPIPPVVDAPPIKHAAIASSSNPFPPFGVAEFNRPVNTMPARAARTPMLT